MVERKRVEYLKQLQHLKQMKKILSLLIVMLTLCTLSVHAQRPTDKLDRGLIAVPSGSGSFVTS